MTQADILIREDLAGVVRLTLNTPSSLNALSEGMLAALKAQLADLSMDTSVRAIIVRGAGAHFCAGHNLKEMTARRRDGDGGFQYFQDLFALCSSLMQQIQNLPQPVIAQVQGIATAAGCQLVASCDLAVAADDSRFATSGVNIGLFCSTPMVALSRNMARKMAMEMLLLGEFIAADRARELGLVNRVVPAAQVADAALSMARKIADKSSAAIKIGKRAFYDQLALPLDQAYAHTGRVMAENMMAQDAAAGIGAFLAKQPMPDWTGE